MMTTCSSCLASVCASQNKRTFVDSQPCPVAVRAQQTNAHHVCAPHIGSSVLQLRFGSAGIFLTSRSAAPTGAALSAWPTKLVLALNPLSLSLKLSISPSLSRSLPPSTSPSYPLFPAYHDSLRSLPCSHTTHPASKSAHSVDSPESLEDSRVILAPFRIFPYTCKQPGLPTQFDKLPECQCSAFRFQHIHTPCLIHNTLSYPFDRKNADDSWGQFRCFLETSGRSTQESRLLRQRTAHGHALGHKSHASYIIN